MLPEMPTYPFWRIRGLFPLPPFPTLIGEPCAEVFERRDPLVWARAGLRLRPRQPPPPPRDEGEPQRADEEEVHPPADERVPQSPEEC